MIALKESQAVEHLTRITILLAKITIVFLPVSLMTGYFSTQIEELQGIYTARTYWVSFGVIVGLSLLGLIVFGIFSGTVEGKPFYQSLSKYFLDKTKARYRKGRGRGVTG